MTTYKKQWKNMTSMEKNAFLWAVSDETAGDRLIDRLSDLGREGKNDVPEYTFTMQINGVDVDAERVIERMEQACEYTAAVKSREALEAKFNELSEAFEPIKSILDAAEARLRADLGIEKDSWDY